MSDPALLVFMFAVFIVAAGMFWENNTRRAGAPERRARPAGRVMTERAVRAALCVDETTPLWCAVQQLLDVQIARAVEEATDPGNALKPPLPAFYSGAVRHLEIFRDFLLTERERAMQEASDED